MRTAAVAAAVALPLLVSAPHGCGDHPSCDGHSPLTINPLKELAPLPKTHYSWAIYPPFMDNASVADGALVDYVRITGALTPTDTLQTTHGARTAVAICAKASSMEGCLKVGSRHEGSACRAFAHSAHMQPPARPTWPPSPLLPPPPPHH